MDKGVKSESGRESVSDEDVKVTLSFAKLSR